MWNIRVATDQDVKAIASLITSLGYETTEDEMRNRLQRIVADERYVTLVAEDGSKVAGFLGLEFGLYYEYTGSYARIVAFSVSPEMRRKGVGSKLIAAAESISRSRGALACIVNSGLHRTETHKFYENRGFLYRGKAFYKRLEFAKQGTSEGVQY